MRGLLPTRHPRNTLKFTMRHNAKVRKTNLIQKRPDREHLGPAAIISPRFNSDRIQFRTQQKHRWNKARRLPQRDRTPYSSQQQLFLGALLTPPPPSME